MFKLQPTHNKQIKPMPQAACFIESVVCFEASASVCDLNW